MTAVKDRYVLAPTATVGTQQQNLIQVPTAVPAPIPATLKQNLLFM